MPMFIEMAVREQFSLNCSIPEDWICPSFKANLLHLEYYLLNIMEEKHNFSCDLYL